MPSMPVHHSSMGAFNMMQYAQAVAGMMQQQQSQQQAQSHRNQPAPPPPPPPPSQAHSSGGSSLDSLLRANGLHTDHHRFVIELISFPLLWDYDNSICFHQGFPMDRHRQRWWTALPILAANHHWPEWYQAAAPTPEVTQVNLLSLLLKSSASKVLSSPYGEKTWLYLVFPVMTSMNF